MITKYLKALRPQTGSYGSVDAGGVVGVTVNEAEVLLKTGTWTEATGADMRAAKARQDAFVSAGTAFPVGPQFAHVGLSGPAAVESEALRLAEERETDLQAKLDAALARVGELEGELAESEKSKTAAAAPAGSVEEGADKTTENRPSKSAEKD